MSEEYLEFRIQTDETPETMEMSFDELVQLIRAEHNERLEQLLADFESMVAKRLPGQTVQVQSAFDITKTGCPLHVYVIVSLHATVEESPPTDSVPDLTMPPNLIPAKRMAERSFQHALVFWWPDPSPGVLYILWDDSHDHKWESIPDADHPNLTGFEWIADQRPEMGGPTTDEGHGMGLVKEEDGVTWIVAPTDLDVFALLPDGTWQIVIA